MRTKTKTCQNARLGEFHIVRDNGCVTCANHDEIGRFNERVKALADANTPLLVDSPGSLSHGYQVLYMRHNFDLVTKRKGDSDFFTATWALCNDDRWAKLLKRAGVERHPMNAAYTAR